MGNYYDWANSEQTCRDCGWKGRGDAATIRESFNDGVEYECPKCGTYFRFVAFPLLHESLTDPRASAEDRKFAEIVMRRVVHKESDGGDSEP
jgi:hypothetical protein